MKARRRRRRSGVSMPAFPVVLAAGLLAGCVSGGGSGVVDDRTTVGLGTVEGEGTATTRGSVTLTRDPSEGALVVEAGLRETWAALQAMVTTLELPVAAVEADAGAMLVRGRLPRLDGQRMSRWFDCGRDITGPVADRSRIDVALQLRLEPEGPQSTRVAYTLQATARPRFNSDNLLACTPEASLPEFLLEALTAELGGGASEG